MFDSEGINGNMYSEDMDFGGEYFKTVTKKLSLKDPYYYHVPLFQLGEIHSVVRQTRLAILFKVEQGKFWVPKSLLDNTRIANPLVHKSFERNYIKES